ncbi:MAG: hypothetical protein NVSMB25_02100 [Thermoleophilaceae bacterium]
MRIPLLLVVLALLLRLGFVISTPHFATHHDDRDYLGIALTVSHTGLYPARTVWLAPGHCPAATGRSRALCATTPGARGAWLRPRPTAYRPPGYPYALALAEKLGQLLGAGPIAVARVFQALLGTLIVALIGLLAWRIWGRRIALIAMTLAAVEVPLILLSGTITSESLFVALELGALVAVLSGASGGQRRRWLLIAGVLTGLAALTRANGLVLLVPVAVLAWQRSRNSHRLIASVAVGAAALACVGVWTVRNAEVLGKFVPISTESGGTLVGTYNATSRADRSTPANWLVLQAIPRYAALAREQLTLSETALDSRLRSDALQFAAAHPAYVPAVVWWNTVRLLELAGSRRVRFGAATVDLPGDAAVAGAICFHVLAVLALIGALLPAARRSPRAIWLAPILLFASTVVVTSETPRFRAGLEPFVVILAALAVDRAFDLIDRRRRPQHVPGRTAPAGVSASPGARAV